MDGKELTGFCAPVTTLSGCKCHANWQLNGTSYYGSCANTGDPLGSWCVVDKATCPSSYRAHGYGAKTVAASVAGVTTNLTGQDFDYWCGAALTTVSALWGGFSACDALRPVFCCSIAASSRLLLAQHLAVC